MLSVTDICRVRGGDELTLRSNARDSDSIQGVFPERARTEGTALRRSGDAKAGAV